MRKRDELIAGCMAKAHDDEMTFVLLGRDVAAPLAIRAWTAERIRLGKNQPGDAQLIEAEECARLMEAEQHRYARPSPAAKEE
jgi:phage terminase Nu1 subunit (DNA packaging protein)